MTSDHTQSFPTRRHTLDNGLRVVLQPDRRVPLVAVNLWYHVGSKNERPGRTGFAHLFEHLLFEGSEHVGARQHFHYVQQAGGVANGSTWYDRTNYHETLPSHQLDLGLWLEADRMGFFLPAINQEMLDNQRDVVINERRQRVDNQPYGLAYERLHELLYPEEHPYRWPVIGYIEDLEAATLDDVRAFFQTYYVPNNAVLSLAGDFDPDHALDRVHRFFGDIPAGAPIPRPTPPRPRLDAERRETLEDQVQAPRLYMGFHGPPYGDPAWYAGELWTTAMCEGKSSVMYEDLVHRRQLAQDIGLYLYRTEIAATLTVVSTAQDGVEIGTLQAAIDQHLADAAESPLTPEHVERARNLTVSGLYDRLQYVEKRADLIGQSTTYFDDPDWGFEEAARYDEIDAESMRAFVAEHCGTHQRAVVTVVPAA